MEQIQTCDFWNNFFLVVWQNLCLRAAANSVKQFLFETAEKRFPRKNFLKTFHLWQKQNITFWHLHYTWGDVNLRLRVANMHILTRSCGAYQGWAGIPVPGHSREYRPPIPVPENWEWFFHSRSRSQKLGMLFFIPVPVPKIWECNFPFPFPLPGMDYQSRE